MRDAGLRVLDLTSIDTWWDSMDCRLRRIAVGDGVTDDPTNSWCQGTFAELGQAEKDRVEAIFKALTSIDCVVQQMPEVSITAGDDITEGGNAVFTVTASPAPHAALSVTIAVSQTGDFGVSPGSQTVTIPTTGSATLTIATTNDNVDEANGSVTATVNSGTGYTVDSTAGSATVVVEDDDDTSPPPPTTPEVSITAGDDITEGGNAVFTVTASPAPHAALSVTIAVSQTGDFGVSPGSQTVTIPTSGSATLTIATTNDNVDEANGSVTATVNSGTGYTVSTTAGSATVVVEDDDDTSPPPPTTPEVSITAGDDITEGGNAVFTVTASPAPHAALSVTIAVSQTGDFGVFTWISDSDHPDQRQRHADDCYDE